MLSGVTDPLYGEEEATQPSVECLTQDQAQEVISYAAAKPAAWLAQENISSSFDWREQGWVSRSP